MLTRWAKLIGSLVFFLLDRLWYVLARLIGREQATPCVVLYYHGVPEEHRQLFARQMDTLRRWAKPIRADAVPPQEKGVRHAAVTFDDGLLSVWENALPELSTREIPATIFVPTAWLGKPPGWGKHTATAVSGERVISGAELASHRDSTLLLIGSHSATHPKINRLSDVDAIEELRDSKRVLEEILGYEVVLFSFPHGETDARTISFCRQEGYKKVFSVQPTYVLQAGDEYVMGRVSVSPEEWPIEFWLKLMGAYRWLPVAFALKRALLAACRQVCLRRSNVVEEDYTK